MVNAYKLVYLPDGKTIDASKEAGVENLAMLRVRIVGNKYFVDLIAESGTKDARIKRVAQLLQKVSRHETDFCNFCDEAFEICAKDPRLYRGPHFQLSQLKDSMDRAGDFMYEYSKRILLYLELLRTTGSTMDDSARITIQTSITTQKELLYAARWSVIKEMALDVRPPPGPASLPYGHPEGVANPEEQDVLPFLDGKPVPQLELSMTTDRSRPINWRYDPGFKVPGSQHCKFLRFPGPYFAPVHDPQDPHDRFFLPEATTQILYYFVRKYDQVLQNFTTTGRLPQPRNDKEATKLLEQQKKVAFGSILAEMSGEKYDLLSIVDKFAHQESVENSTEPYIYCRPGTMIRQVNFGDGTGRFKLEDWNRAWKVAITGEHPHVKTLDEGMCVVFDRVMWD
ncbi:hypothetical protein VPNG_07387 [Cytospora leucostoma]|uniref:Uncharacterized protein n=1 Tax=Cytospora leucostoma TaxID=1230097 RepID=A0A423WV38_9PEZI|nr:hypothetical protein VPNG_07387 [Cytospora leucostoma]